MMVAIFIFNVCVFLSIFLAIIMYNNNLKKISQSIDIFLDPQAYRPKRKVRFIGLLVDKYQSYEGKLDFDMASFIKSNFYKNKIGVFKTQRVETTAIKGKRLLWASIITMVLFESLNQGLGQSRLNSILIIISAILGIVIVFIEMYVDIEIGKDRLFLKLENYLNNDHPQFQGHKKEKEDIAKLLRKIERLESKIKSYEESDCKEGEEVLSENDIIQILKQFDIS